MTPIMKKSVGYFILKIREMKELCKSALTVIYTKFVTLPAKSPSIWADIAGDF